MPTLRPPMTSPVYGNEDALQDAVLEKLEAGTRQDASAEELLTRAASLFKTAARTARKQHNKLSRMAQEIEPTVNEEDTAILRIDIQRFLAALDQDTRDICLQILQGATLREIAKGLGTSKDSVQRRLRDLAPLAQQYGLGPIRRSAEAMDEYDRKFQRAYMAHRVGALRSELADLAEQRRASNGEVLVGRRPPRG